MPTATPTMVWFFSTAGVAEVIPSLPSVALAAEADALEGPVTVVVLGPEPPTAELKSVDKGVAELDKVATALDD